MIRPSTFSIAAYDPNEKAWGIAVASKFLAAGAVVPWARAGAGAVATQSFANTSFGPRGLAMMEEGLTAEETMKTLLLADPESEQRQVGLIDADGQPATFTGGLCFDWAGGITGKHFAIQGNLLVGPAVVQAMADAYQVGTGNLAWRLYTALLAGDLAGGDRRGRQSAAILVVKQNGGYGGFNDRWIDYRVDDDPDPVRRLKGLLELHDLYFDESPEAEKIPLRDDPLIQLKKVLISQGYYTGKLTGIYDHETRDALTAFIGNENFEDRFSGDSGLIDQPVLAYLLKRYGEQK